MEEFTLLIERAVSEKTSVFIDAQNDYREKHREATDRPLTAQEAAQIAAAMTDALGKNVQDDPGGAVRQIQESGLRAYDEPTGVEVLFAAGLATAPAMLDIALQLVALIELPEDAFEQAREAATLDDSIAEARRALSKLPVADARSRAIKAVDHLTSAMGVAPGEAVRLVTRLVGQAMGQALQMNPQLGSALSSLVGSLDSAGPGEPSSTTPPTETP
jgi:hypothetical protein